MTLVTREMTRAQKASFQSIDGRWPVKRWVVDGDGVVQFLCEDGDAGFILPGGEWEWLS